jgi:malate dehydrogenase (oxaloacetate-decarboxylating)
MVTMTGASIPHGRELLRNPRFNRGTAFTYEERSALGLNGLLPAGAQTLEQQSRRPYEQYQAQPTNLARV